MTFVQALPFVPCFMQVTKVSSPYAGPPIPPQTPVIGSAGFDHNNPQAISIDLHIWSWFDGIMKVKDGKSGLPIAFLNISANALGGETFNEPPPGTMTPFNTKLQIPQRALQSHYDTVVKPFNMGTALHLLVVSAWRDPQVQLTTSLIAIGFV